MVDIDAAKAKRAGVSPTEILSTLSGYYGGQYVSNINRFSKVYRVMIQADPKYRLDTESLNNVYVRTQNGEMAPVSQFVKLTKVYGSETLNRFNMYSSISVNGTCLLYTSGLRIDRMRRQKRSSSPGRPCRRSESDAYGRRDDPIDRFVPVSYTHLAPHGGQSAEGAEPHRCARGVGDRKRHPHRHRRSLHAGPLCLSLIHI